MSWLLPQSIFGSFFNSSESAKPNNKLQELENNLKECINQKTQIERKYTLETEELSKKIEKLRLESDTKGMQVEALTKKLGRRQHRIKELKKVIEEMAEKLSLLDQRAIDIAREKEMIALKLKKWQPLEKLKQEPEELLILLHKRNVLIFQETGSLEGDINQLKSILIEKLKEYNKETVSGRRVRRSVSCAKIELGNGIDMKEIKSLLISVECPFRIKEMQTLIEEYKVKITGLEKKEKFLNKIMNTSVISLIDKVV